MQKLSSPILSFQDLKTWQNGHKLVIEIYKVTRIFPREEMFGLINQLRRAVVSFTSNIAEGFGRKSYKEKSRFYLIALGSLFEIQNQLLVAKDVEYISQEDYTKLLKLTTELNKMTNGLIKKSKEFS